MPENPFPRNTADNDIPNHFLYRGPSPLVGMVAVIVALVILAYAVAEVRTIARSQPTLAIASTSGPVPEGTPILQITESAWTLNGQPLQESDRLFRLSGAAARATAIMVEYPPDLPAGQLENALETVNRAGFTQVGMQAFGNVRSNSSLADKQTTTSR